MRCPNCDPKYNPGPQGKIVFKRADNGEYHGECADCGHKFGYAFQDYASAVESSLASIRTIINLQNCDLATENTLAIKIWRCPECHHPTRHATVEIRVRDLDQDLGLSIRLCPQCHWWEPWSLKPEGRLDQFLIHKACPSCGGTGELIAFATRGDNEGKEVSMPCSQCRGNGTIVSD